MLLAGVAVVFAASVGAGELLLGWNPHGDVDGETLRSLVADRTGALTTAMRIVSRVGDPGDTSLLAVVVAGIVCVVRRSLRPLLLAVLAIAATTLVVDVVKAVVRRPRPPVGLAVQHAAGFSFPSGHAAHAVAGFLLAAWLVTRCRRVRRTRLPVWLCAVLGAALVGFSRLYLGVHYLSDVVAGSLIGGLCVAVVITALGPHRPAAPAAAPSKQGGDAVSP